MAEMEPIPWYGVLAPEGITSGDRRRFNPGSLRMRSLPLPLTWQKVSGMGHEGSVTVAKIEKVWRQGGLVWGSGHSLTTPEAAEWAELVGEFGKYGVSIDADDIDEFAVEQMEDGTVNFLDARVCSASTVSIPAFAEAFVSLGEFTTESASDVPTGDNPIPDGDPEELRDYNQEERDRLAEEGKAMDDGSYPIVDLEDLKNAIQAIGRAKDPAAARRHIKKRARELGHEDLIPEDWAGEAMTASGAEITEVIVGGEEALRSLTAAAPKKNPPHSWFTDPGLEQITPVTVTKEGEFYAHVAQWGECHIGFDGECVEPPISVSDYAYFRNGVIETDQGPVAVGNITMGGGHAAAGLGWRPALDHYDSTCSVIADVAVGEDTHGIWVHGALREGVTEDQVAELKASGGLSGDWREVRRGSGELELVAALAINVGGFPIPRIQIAASGGHRTALVAAGAVAGRSDDDGLVELVERVVTAIEERREARVLHSELTKELVGDSHEQLRAEIERN